ncbi:MAG TPA: hypothetical protein VGP82_10590 [Ktedonobacterales bacterium]|jgi:predicted RNA-binding Zn-ribbon protein involved in translation (DUF1610 family)|nr:hypothetical protein [Ktedonobacterales bacterium]
MTTKPIERCASCSLALTDISRVQLWLLGHTVTSLASHPECGHTMIYRRIQ